MQTKHILLVDDDPGLRQLLMTTLAAPEFHISQASSGDAALTQARALHPDLLVLDIHLGLEQPSGIEICRQLKRDPATAAIRILMLTGTSGPRERQDAAQAGADYYFTKPFSPRALLDYIYAVLGE